MYNYLKTQDSAYDPTKLAIHYILRTQADFVSNCGHFFMKTVSFDDIVLVIDKENIVTLVDFHCGSTFYSEAATKVGEINQDWKNISRSCKEPKCITNADQHSCF